MYFTKFLHGPGMLIKFSKGRGDVCHDQSSRQFKENDNKDTDKYNDKDKSHQDNGVPDSTLPLKAVKNFLQACVSTSTLRNQVFHMYRHTEQTYRC